MASLKSKFSIAKINTKLFLLLFLIFIGIIFVKGSGDFSEGLQNSYNELSSILVGANAQGTSQYQSDVGLMDGESDEGCKYSDQEGLVYFCGYVKSAKDYSPLEGITVAVYEELPNGPSLLEPEGGLFSPNGKYGGNLIHLFSSTSTNAQGHYEITARQGRNIHVAFLCGNEFVGGLKRIEEISRIEIMNDLVSCPVRGYAEPPAQLSYVDREGFLECLVNFTGSFVPEAVTEAEHFVPTVGLGGNPSSLMESQIYISNFDFRFMSYDGIASSLNFADNSLFYNTMAAAFDLDWWTPAPRSFWGDPATNLLWWQVPIDVWDLIDGGVGKGRGFVKGEAGWIGPTSHGGWRREDCRATYSFPGPNGGAMRPKNQPCEPDGMSLFLSYYEGYANAENLYTMLNHLPFMPPWPSQTAFARIDIRNSIRQVIKDSAQEIRQGDSMWDNYIGKVPRIFQKDPTQPVSETEGELSYNAKMSEKSTPDGIISCDELALQMADLDNRYATSSLAGLATPYEMESDVVENGYFTDWEYEIPVCNDGGTEKTLREVCLEKPGFDNNRLLCRAAMWTVKASGGSVTPYRAQDDSDSYDRNGSTAVVSGGSQNTIRQSIYNAKSNAANDTSNEGLGSAFGNQEWEINHGSYSNVANGNYTAWGFLSGGAGTGKNYLNFYGNPSGSAISDDNILEEETEVTSVGFGQTPTSNVGRASPNAIKNDIVIQDVGTNSVAQCSVSTMLETVKFQIENGVIQQIVNPGGGGEGGTEATNKKLELIDMDMRVDLQHPITVATWAVLSNFFIGNPGHSGDPVVGSGVFYTGDASYRDMILATRGSNGAKQGMRDFFDSLRSIATPNQVIDFTTLSAGDAANAFGQLFGFDPNASGVVSAGFEALGVIKNFLLGSPEAPQKSYAHRYSNSPTNKNLPLSVGYPFWECPDCPEDADPFRIAFPIPEAPWFPDNWGSEPSYPWNGVTEGRACATYVDEIVTTGPDGETLNANPDVPGLSNNAEPDADARYSAKTLGLSRTCRVKKCEVWDMIVKCDGRGNIEEPYEFSESGAPHVEPRNPSGDCDEDQRFMCAIQRKDIDRKEEALSRADCGPYKCDLDGDKIKDDICYPDEDKVPIPDCDMERAGPYAVAGSVSYNIKTKITQDSHAPDREVVIPVDGLKQQSDEVAMSFYNPSKTDLFVETQAIKEVDIAHSVSADPEALVTRGYPTKSIGGINQAIFDPGSHPYVSPYKIEDNGITYHCEELGVKVDGKLNSCLDNENPDINCWKCPIAPLPKCTGLFGQVEGIDEIVISPKGLEGITMNFDFGAFEEMLPIYVQVEEETGVPCEVLAALHFREGSNQPGSSILDGKSLRGGSQLEDARVAADHLLSKKSCVSGVCATLCGTSRVPGGLAIKNLTDLKQMIAYWGGGGNDNCNPEIADLTEYDDLHGCPASYGCGDYDSYVMSNVDSNHDDYSIIWPMDKVDVTQPSLFAQLEAMFPGSIGGGGASADPAFGGVRSDAACWIIQNAPEALGRSYGAVGGLCPPPIPELRPGALAMAKYIYEISVGLRQP